MANEKMEMQDKLKIGIGTKEAERLKPEVVKCLGVKVEERKSQTGEVMGDKVVFICKHPAKDEPIQISKAKHEKAKDQLKVTGVWLQLDSEGKIGKNTCLAKVLSFYKLENLESATGTDLQTTLDDEGYLCIKAY